VMADEAVDAEDEDFFHVLAFKMPR
jgi:hypothetical protein